MTILTLCRFDPSGNLSIHPTNLSTATYIAISHVWSTKSVTWRSIPGVPHKVLCSPQKARFIQRKLPSLVGETLFWMDILAVDQESEEARVAVVHHIPAVYRNAQKTIVIREDGGFRGCCKVLTGLLDENAWNEKRVRDKDGNLVDPAISVVAERHLKECHGAGLDESWLGRLWPLQETNLSRTVQFDVCERVPGAEAKAGGSPATLVELRQTLLDLDTAAEAWAEQGQFMWLADEWEETFEKKTKELRAAFMSAVFANGSVSRPPDPIDPSTKSVYHTLAGSSLSFRKTSKPRDYILALFPQCEWYNPPENIRALKWGELWEDCITQFQEFHRTSILKEQPLAVAPKVVVGMLDPACHVEDAEKASPDVPYPETLGDFSNLAYYLKKMGSNTDFFDELNDLASSATWHLKRADPATLSIGRILELVSHTLNFSRHALNYNWLHQHLVWREQKEEELGAVVMLLGMDFADSAPVDSETSVGMAGMKANLLHVLRVLNLRGAPKYINHIGNLQNSLRMGLRDGQVAPRFYHHPWRKILENAAAEDSLQLRADILELAALVASGLGVNALNWVHGDLVPWILTLDKEGCKEPLVQTICLASPSLVVGEDDEVLAYEDALSPYIRVRSLRDGMRPRAVGMAPEPETWESEDFVIFLDEGCPVALPRKYGEARDAAIKWYFDVRETVLDMMGLQ